MTIKNFIYSLVFLFSTVALLLTTNHLFSQNPNKGETFPQKKNSADALHYSKQGFNETQKHAFYREMVELDVNLRAAISNAALNDVTRTASAFWLMSRFVTTKNPRFQESTRFVFDRFEKLGVMQHLKTIQAIAYQNYQTLQNTHKQKSAVDWSKVDTSLNQISQNCRACHLKMIGEPQ